MFTATLTVSDLDVSTPRDAAEALLAAAGSARPLSVETVHQHTGQRQLIKVTDFPDEMRLDISLAERDTILAALRYWQERLTITDPHAIEDESDELAIIATDDGSHPALTADEIDALCERINK